MSGADSVLLHVLDLCGDLLADVDAHVRELVLRGGAKDEQKLLEVRHGGVGTWVKY
jgi:hypothetical protein